MQSRLELHNKFLKLTKNVYYQPPVGTIMKYPAIRYTKNDIENTFADDGVYMQDHSYMVTVIDKNPDSEIAEAISKFPMSDFIRHDTVEGLNHDVFVIHYK